MQVKFLLYSPLNQGLKRSAHHTTERDCAWFLLYSPLNQGLKLEDKNVARNSTSSFYSTVH